MQSLLPMAAALAMTLTSNSAVTVDGAVNKPGDVKLEKPTKLRTFLKDCGGVRQDGDAKKITIRTVDGEVRIVDATRLDQNPTLNPGDAVSVPVMNPNDYVFLSGGVQNRGAIDFKPGMDLLSTVRAAGTPEGVGTNQVKLTRIESGQAKTYRFDLSKIEKGMQANIALMPADRVEVPTVRAREASDRQLLTIVLIGLLVLLVLD